MICAVQCESQSENKRDLSSHLCLHVIRMHLKLHVMFAASEVLLKCRALTL